MTSHHYFSIESRVHLSSFSYVVKDSSHKDSRTCWLLVLPKETILVFSSESILVSCDPSWTEYCAHLRRSIVPIFKVAEREANFSVHGPIFTKHQDLYILFGPQDLSRKPNWVGSMNVGAEDPQNCHANASKVHRFLTNMFNP